MLGGSTRGGSEMQFSNVFLARCRFVLESHPPRILEMSGDIENGNSILVRVTTGTD